MSMAGPTVAQTGGVFSSIYLSLYNPEALTVCEFRVLFFLFHHSLGPNKHGLVTYIQVNVYIGNAMSWLNGG